MKEGREIIMANYLLLKTYHENDNGLHEKKGRELLLIATAGKFLGVIRSPIKGFTRITADQLSQLGVRNKDTIRILSWQKGRLFQQ